MKKLLLVTPVIVLLVFTMVKPIRSALQINLANVIIHKSFSKEAADARSRQRSMSLAAKLMSDAGNVIQDNKQADDIDNHTMILAAFMGQRYHRLHDWNNAALWYSVASRSKPTPEKQKQLLVSPLLRINEDGTLYLSSNIEMWRIRPDTASGAKLFATSRDTIKLNCTDIDEEPKKAALLWNYPLSIPYHHTLVYRVKTDVGTILSLETVTKGEIERHFVHDGTGEWEGFEIYLNVDQVTFIYVLIRKNSESNQSSCGIEFEEIEFRLDADFAER